MKAYYFTCNSGWIGGVGVVQAETKQKALELANEVIIKDGIDAEPIEEKYLIELGEEENAILIVNGDY